MFIYYNLKIVFYLVVRSNLSIAKQKEDHSEFKLYYFKFSKFNNKFNLLNST